MVMNTSHCGASSGDGDERRECERALHGSSLHILRASCAANRPFGRTISTIAITA